MFVSDEMIEELKTRFGKPKIASFSFETDKKEFDFIRSTQKNGRKHDITLYIFKEDQIIVIAKPFYPPGLFRAPSGGLNPGESFDAGVAREMLEEIGCEIEVQHYLLKTDVSFCSNDDTIEWNSHVFQAVYVSGDFNFTDHREIREVGLAHLDDFTAYSKIMRASHISGLHYRADLHDTIIPLLKK